MLQQLPSFCRERGKANGQKPQRQRNRQGNLSEKGWFILRKICKHPMDGVRYTKPVRAVDDIKFLTVEEQQRFLDTAKRLHSCNQYALILETGLRTGELIRLAWDAIDREKRTLTVNKTLEYRYKQGVWRAGPPKTQHSCRTIPLTNRAYVILQPIKAARSRQHQNNHRPLFPCDGRFVIQSSAAI